MTLGDKKVPTGADLSVRQAEPEGRENRRTTLIPGIFQEASDIESMFHPGTDGRARRRAAHPRRELTGE